MKILLMLLAIVMPFTGFALEQDNSANAVPVIMSGGATVGSYGTSVITARRASAQEAEIKRNQKSIADQIAKVEEITPQQIALQATSAEQIAAARPIFEELPANLGLSANNAIYFQEFIDDKILADRANVILIKMREALGIDLNSTRETHKAKLENIRNLRNSSLQKEYDAIVEEARSRGLIQTRELSTFFRDFDMVDDKDTLVALLDREDLRHRGFINENGTRVSNPKNFVLGIKKKYSPVAAANLRSAALKKLENAKALSLAEQTTLTEKNNVLDKSSKRNNRVSKLTRIGSYIGVPLTVGLGYLITSSTSVDTQLLDETNPSAVSIETINTPKANQ